MTMSVFMYASMISKHHGIFWNPRDVLSICLQRGNLHTKQPLRESWLLRNGQNRTVHQILEILFIELFLLVFVEY